MSHGTFLNKKETAGNDKGSIGTLVKESDLPDRAALQKTIEQVKSELKEEQQILYTIFEKSPAAMALWRGNDLVFEMLNPEYQKIFGDRELLGRPFLEACPEFKDQPFAKLILDVLKTGVPYVGTEELARIARTKGGPLEDRYFDFTYVQVKDSSGKPYGVYDHAIDVTDRVLAKRNLRMAIEELRLAKEEAVRANELKTSFIANMSHEIRTPLGAILGFSSLLKDTNLSEADRDTYIETIFRNGSALNGIIDDILDIAKVEANKLDLEQLEFSFPELLNDVINLFGDKVKRKGLQMSLHMGSHVPQRICTDPTRLRQILINLVGNAVKFTEHGSVKINVRSIKIPRQKSVTITIDIEDTGVGISEEHQDKLFQPFMQADNSITRKFGGTGLGLALSRRLAHALNGEISISSCALGVGCVFTLTFTASIPTVAVSKSVVAPQETQKISLEGVNVLVVDDSPENQFLVERLLVTKGASVEKASDGQEAYCKALAGDFDVILMDIQMPTMDGYQAKRVLDENGYSRPVVALTAHAMAEDHMKSMERGFVAHLTKPINKSELLTTVSNLRKELH